VPVPAQQPPEDPSSLLAVVLAFLNRPKPSDAFGPVAGVSALYVTHDLRLAAAACLFGPAVIAAGRVLAKWVEKLAPP
jgi:hypothetical protein